MTSELMITREEILTMLDELARVSKGWSRYREAGKTDRPLRRDMIFLCNKIHRLHEIEKREQEIIDANDPEKLLCKALQKMPDIRYEPAPYGSALAILLDVEIDT